LVCVADCWRLQQAQQETAVWFIFSWVLLQRPERLTGALPGGYEGFPQTRSFFFDSLNPKPNEKAYVSSVR
jgi:hypothetical protein